MLKYCIEKELHLQMSTRRSFLFFITRCFWTLYCLFLCQREGDTALHLTDLPTTHLSFFPQRFLLLSGVARSFNLLVTLYKFHLCFMCIIAGMVVDLRLLQMGEITSCPSLIGSLPLQGLGVPSESDLAPLHISLCTGGGGKQYKAGCWWKRACIHHV